MCNKYLGWFRAMDREPAGSQKPAHWLAMALGGVCIIHTMRSSEIIKKLEKAGWVLRGVKGSHHIYTHPQRGGHISVPHPKQDMGAGLVHKLLKQSGLKGAKK